MPSLADLIRMGKQYIGDAMPGGSLNPETAPVARQANYLSGILDPASQVSFLQGASNSAASNLSAPVDGINWLLGKAGLPVSKAPVGGSAWLRQAGFTAEPKNRNAGLLGEFVGGVMPIVSAAKAPQIAALLNQAGRNLSAPRTLNPQTGAIVWHGSPHKFDKFSLDKIGTGEGAQAYGHGLYLAEAPEVAKDYQSKLGGGDTYLGGHLAHKYGTSSLSLRFDNPSVVKTAADELAVDAMSRFGNAKQALNFIDSRTSAFNGPSPEVKKQAMQLIEAGLVDYKPKGYLYKTDIPDEAVARFLDWDKPLSQQAPEVQAAIGRLKNANPSGYQKLVDAQLGGPLMEQATGRDLYQSLGRDAFNDSGIPGIRYLDGGSRSAGQGSSNFVAFDPEMIRILERNGQATGLEPWKPGEYRLKDLIGKE